jgi:hypothetical protein
MDPRLKAILQKAKAIDEKAKQYDRTDTAVLESNVSNRQSSLSESIGEPNRKSTPQIPVGSESYKQRVKESKLPPEIQRAMLENPIPQPDAPGTFSLDVDDIREINPSYGSNTNEGYYSENDEYDFLTEQRHKKVEMVKGPTQQGFDSHVIKKMIAEEIAKALPGIVEKYFDKKMIQENVKILSILNNKVRKIQ